jgi:hypothetical protein
VPAGQAFTLTANGVDDPDGDLPLFVSFYRETNSVAGLQSNIDQFITQVVAIVEPEDDSFSALIESEGLPRGIQTFYAIAADSKASGNVVQTSLKIVEQTAPLLPGDYNDNGIVDAVDYVVWRNTRNNTAVPFTGADGNGNGTIDQGDYGIWRANFGRTAGTAALASQAPFQGSDDASAAAIESFAQDGDGSISASTNAGTDDRALESAFESLNPLPELGNTAVRQRLLSKASAERELIASRSRQPALLLAPPVFSREQDRPISDGTLNLQTERNSEHASSELWTAAVDFALDVLKTDEM